MAAKAVAFREASRPEFKTYAAKIVENAALLAQCAIAEGMEVLTGGTDNHLLLINVQNTFGLTGRQAESALRDAGITLNRNSLPFDANGPWYTSGLRVGTPAATTLGMGDAQMKEIAAIFKQVLSNTRPTVNKAGESSRAKYKIEPKAANEARERIKALLAPFPLYPNLDLDLMMSAYPALKPEEIDSLIA
jgi:glycine hydroxymethyltransferase